MKVSRDELGLRKDRFTMLLSAYEGWTNPYKGWDIVVPLVERLREARALHSLQLLVLGANSVPAALASLATVKCLGYVANDDTLARAYSAADVVLFPSLAESFGLVALEAIACGCPVVASDVGGVGDVVVTGVSGFVVSRRDVGDFAQAVECLIKRDRGLWRETCRTHFEENFEARSQVIAYQRVYESLRSDIMCPQATTKQL